MKNIQPNPFVIAEAGSCIGCKACELACFAVHNRDNGVGAAVGTVTIPVIPRLYVIRTDSFTMPVQCRQCENAPCAAACPVQAIRQEDGTIVIDEEACIGCKSCALACPFGAVSLYKAYSGGQEIQQPHLKERQNSRLDRKAKVIAYKCDLCRNVDFPDSITADKGSEASDAVVCDTIQGRSRERTPACVSVCPVGALTLINPDSRVIPSRTVLGIKL